MPSRVYWTRQAREDLRAVRTHIARDALATASGYVRLPVRGGHFFFTRSSP